MDLATAKTSFLALVDGTAGSAIPGLLQWIQDSFGTEAEEAGEAEATAALGAIAADLRARLPPDAIAASESLRWPSTGLDADCRAETTVHVDSFLYSDDEIDLLVDQGAFSRNYCKSCGSKDTAPLTFISHSLGLPTLRFMFKTLLPPSSLEGKVVLDVGSRLGAVLFAGFFYSPGARFVGVEANPDLARLQADVIQQHGLGERVAVLAQDLRTSAGVVGGADVVILNNVFQFFLSLEEQAQCWAFLRQSLKTGALVLTNPSLEKATDYLSIGFSIGDWVELIDTSLTAAKYAGTDEELCEDLSALCLYRVK